MKDETIFVMVAIMCCIVGIAVGLLLGSLGIRAVRKQAIQHGAAEWVVDQDTGETTFTWKSAPEAVK
jgi:uncharacterized membrane-anchored protein YhcB (DUF1043 family)